MCGVCDDDDDDSDQGDIPMCGSCDDDDCEQPNNQDYLSVKKKEFSVFFSFFPDYSFWVFRKPFFSRFFSYCRAGTVFVFPVFLSKK